MGRGPPAPHPASPLPALCPGSLRTVPRLSKDRGVFCNCIFSRFSRWMLRVSLALIPFFVSSLSCGFSRTKAPLSSLSHQPGKLPLPLDSSKHFLRRVLWPTRRALPVRKTESAGCTVRAARRPPPVSVGRAGITHGSRTKGGTGRGAGHGRRFRESPRTAHISRKGENSD